MSTKCYGICWLYLPKWLVSTPAPSIVPHMRCLIAFHDMVGVPHSRAIVWCVARDLLYNVLTKCIPFVRKLGRHKRGFRPVSHLEEEDFFHSTHWAELRIFEIPLYTVVQTILDGSRGALAASPHWRKSRKVFKPFSGAA